MAERARAWEAPPPWGSLGPQVTWPPDVGLPPSFHAGEGGPEALEGICLLFQLEGSATATRMGWGRCLTLARRPHSRPRGQEETASPQGRYGKVPLLRRHLNVCGWREDSLQSTEEHVGMDEDTQAGGRRAVRPARPAASSRAGCPPEPDAPLCSCPMRRSPFRWGTTPG